MGGGFFREQSQWVAVSLEIRASGWQSTERTEPMGGGFLREQSQWVAVSLENRTSGWRFP